MRPASSFAGVLAAVRAIGAPALIGVDGYGGAGKTTFAARLAEAVPGSVVVHIDDFAAPSVPEWDWARFRNQVVVPLLAGGAARYQRWDWHTDSGADWVDVPAGALVIAEGVSSTRDEVGAPWALTVWVDAALELRLARARERDGEQLLDRWVTDWIPSEDAYARREDPVSRVDFVVDGAATG